MDEMMFFYQCEQAANCTACTGKAGVCGKSAETADAQDKLTGALIGFATLLLDIGKPIQPPQALLLLEGLFTTITNVHQRQLRPRDGGPAHRQGVEGKTGGVCFRLPRSFAGG